MDHSLHSAHHSGHATGGEGTSPQNGEPGSMFDLIPDETDTNDVHLHHSHSADTPMSHMMSMAFHFGYKETILFSWWNTNSVEGIIGSMIAIFVVATLYEGLKYYREQLYWKAYSILDYRPVNGRQRNVEDQNHITASSSNNESPVHPTMFHLFQTFLHMVQVTLSLMLMLVFMTYNVWLCIAVVLGAALGYFLFCWRKKSVFVDMTEHCH